MTSNRFAITQRNRRRTIILPALATAAMIAGTTMTGCKSTGRRGDRAVVRAASLPAAQLDFPTIAQLSAARTRGLVAVSNAGGKEPMLGTINMYPSQDAGCPKSVTVEMGISYDSGTKEEPSRAAGFYLKPDPANGCKYRDELVMDAGRALDAFIGTRPLDELGALEENVKLDPKKFLEKASDAIRLQDSKAWNLFIKTLLGPVTMDSVQYTIEMLCMDESVGDAFFKATDGSRIPRGSEPEEGPVCPVVARALGDR